MKEQKPAPRRPRTAAPSKPRDLNFQPCHECGQRFGHSDSCGTGDARDNGIPPLNGSERGLW